MCVAKVYFTVYNFIIIGRKKFSIFYLLFICKLQKIHSFFTKQKYEFFNKNLLYYPSIACICLYFSISDYIQLILKVNSYFHHTFLINRL